MSKFENVLKSIGEKLAEKSAEQKSDLNIRWDRITKSDSQIKLETEKRLKKI